jgi:peptidoglycan/LPS O-acetylase OafA/YrhL
MLGEVSKGKDNNLNLIRLLAAVMVIFCHAYPVAAGKSSVDPLSTISHGQITFGNLAVCIFFFYGGFLIAGSAERNRTGRKFFKKRIIRLFPSLITVVLLCVFVLGPILTKFGLIDYFTNLETYKYLLNALLIPIHNLPGVFADNIYLPTVNGPLWTLPVEFLCYVICFVIYRIHVMNSKNMKYSLIFFIPGYIFMFILLSKVPLLQEAMRPMGMFYVGIMFYVYRDNISMNWHLTLVMLCVLLITTLFGGLEYAILLTMPYLFSYVGFATKKISIFKDKLSDISYQMYLTAWPIQQILTQLFGGKMNPCVNFIIALPICFAVSFILYECIDAKISLRKKPELAK